MNDPVNSTASDSADSRASRDFLYGARDTLPMIIGAIPFGILFGALATSAGLSVYETMAMSLFVFAGSSQFVAATLIGQGVGVAVIVTTTFFVNLRHALYSASLGPYFKGLRAGNALENLSDWGLEFAMIVTFIGIVVPLITRFPMLVAALVAIAVGLLARNMAHNLGLIVASVAGVAAGYLAELYSERKHSGAQDL